MKLAFLGTRGGIIARSNLHYHNASLLISFYKTHILIDRGADWLDQPFPAMLKAILVTHAHPDHVGGLKHGAPCPVIASKETWQRVPSTYDIQKKLIINPYEPIKIGALIVQAFPVRHSLHAPAVGYKITGGKNTIFYVSDVASIIKEKKALSNVDIYIGDGAIITRTLLMRKKDHELVGHAPIEEQIKWCVRNNIADAIFSHCGSEITKAPVEKTQEKINRLEKKYNISVTIAHDGLQMII